MVMENDDKFYRDYQKQQIQLYHLPNKIRFCISKVSFVDDLMQGIQHFVFIFPGCVSVFFHCP